MSARGNSQKSPEIRPKKRRGLKPPPVEHRFKPGQSGNPGGRPKLVSDAYKEWLAEVDEHGVTNALRLARSIGTKAVGASDVQAAKELRQATEGDTMRLQTWQTELVEALKAGRLTPQEVIETLGHDEARIVFVAAGQAIPEGTPTGSGNREPGRAGDPA